VEVNETPAMISIIADGFMRDNSALTVGAEHFWILMSAVRMFKVKYVRDYIRF
jgi:hypothetical protein